MLYVELFEQEKIVVILLLNFSSILCKVSWPHFFWSEGETHSLHFFVWIPYTVKYNLFVTLQAAALCSAAKLSLLPLCPLSPTTIYLASLCCMSNQMNSSKHTYFPWSHNFVYDEKRAFSVDNRWQICSMRLCFFCYEGFSAQVFEDC